MAAISTWSTTAANNNSTPPDGWPEGQAPSTVNNCAREMMAAIRTQWENAQWFDYGHTVSNGASNTIKITGDETAKYEQNRRLKILDTAGTLYATIASSSYSSPDTTVTCTLDSGSFTATVTSVALSILTKTNNAEPVFASTSVNAGKAIALAMIFG